MSEPTFTAWVFMALGVLVMIVGAVNALVMVWRSSTATRVQGWLREQRKRNRGR